ncbi:MAG: hypothetical protein NUV73_01555, partial [Candidatus Daviesbacteria bacterium]|nr:hypothetical protein [Candidatus Daviesbacteria bacterium]
QETRGWNEDKKSTYLQRSKEEAHDYRYFPEPDLPELRIKNLESGIKEELPELPWEKSQRFEKEYGIKKADAEILTETGEFADYFEEMVRAGKDIEPKQIANYIINQKIDIKTITPGQVIEKIANKNVGMIEDAGELEKLAAEAIEENPGLVETYKKGKVTVIQAIIGSVMKKTGGKVNPNKVREILEEKLR